MTAPRGTDTGSSDSTRALPHAAASASGTDAPASARAEHGRPEQAHPEQAHREQGPAEPRAEQSARPEPEQSSRPEPEPEAPPAVPRAGGSRPTAPADGPGWAQTTSSRDESRTTVLPGGGAAARPAAARTAATATARTRPAAGARPLAGRTRRARLSLRRIDPWSVFLFSLVVAVFLGIALVVAVAVLYAVLGSLGVTDSVNQLFAEVTGGDIADGELLTSGRIVGGAAVLAAINVVFLTLLATLGSLLYNLCASFTGGLELTFGERD